MKLFSLVGAWMGVCVYGAFPRSKCRHGIQFLTRLVCKRGLIDIGVRMQRYAMSIKLLPIDYARTSLLGSSIDSISCIGISCITAASFSQDGRTAVAGTSDGRCFFYSATDVCVCVCLYIYICV